MIRNTLAGIAAAFLYIAVAAPSFGQSFSAGTEAYNRGDHAAAAREFRPLAEQGDATAKSNLALMYLRGEGVPRNYSKAVKWYRMAAEQGLAKPQYNLGVMYQNSRGVRQDYVKAVHWYRAAAQQAGRIPTLQAGRAAFRAALVSSRAGRAASRADQDEAPVTAPSLAEETSRAYLAKTPPV